MLTAEIMHSDQDRITGADAIVTALEAADVSVVFVGPARELPALYEKLARSQRIRTVPVRHEQGAGHGAEGYALATGQVGVCMATGPGATNLVTSLADAAMDSVPLLAITVQVSDGSRATGEEQETDICGIATPITKHSFKVSDADEVTVTIARAVRLASSGRPGPVLVDITRSAQRGLVTSGRAGPDQSRGLERVTRPPRPPSSQRLGAILKEIAGSRRPVLYVGGGVVRSRASDELQRFVDATDLPVVTTLMARGVLPDSHRRNLGMPGMHGAVTAVAALQLSDLIIALGSRFDDRVTGDPVTFAPGARVVHIDIDPAEIGKNRDAHVALVADCREALERLLGAIDGATMPDWTAWHAHLASLQERYPLAYEPAPDGSLAPQFVLERLGRLAGGPGTIFTTGVGQHQMWAAQYLALDTPGSLLTSGGLGTMGFGIPAAMGAQVGRPDRTVWCVDGDGSFQMTSRELATCASERIPIKVALINNGSLGMVKQLQTLYYDERVNSVGLTSRDTVSIPSFVKLAEALGCVGLSCEKTDQVDGVIAAAMAIDDQPVVVDFQVDDRALVWPSIAAGGSNDDVRHARGLTPAFDRND